MNLDFKFGLGIKRYNTYKPLINYTWSTTINESGTRYLKDIGTSKSNATLYSGRALEFDSAYSQGVSNNHASSSSAMIYTLNGSTVYTETPFNLDSGLNGIYQNVCYLNTTLTQAQIDSFTNYPEDFVVNNSSLFVAHFPMIDTDGYCRDNISNTAYPITNYTSDMNLKSLPYGLQTAKLQIENNVIVGKSSYFECDKTSYADTGWIPDINQDTTIEAIFSLDNTEFTESSRAIILNGTESAYGFNYGTYDGRYQIFLKCHGITYTSYFGSESDKIVYGTIVYNASTKQAKYYVNGVLKRTSQITNTVSGTSTFLLGKRSDSSMPYPYSKPIRLHKVHNKVLEKAEITANYNQYITQGLLDD